MAFINKITVKGTTYNLENLTDGSHVVRLPYLSDDDVFVTQRTLSAGVNMSNLSNGLYTVNLPNDLDQNDIFVLQSKQDKINSSKVDKVDGKGLSTNDFTAADKTKLDGIAVGANKYVLPVAKETELGGVQPVTKTDSMTQDVGVDADGKLYTTSSLNIEIVDALPEVGEPSTFYLVLNDSNTGYKKYLWIVDNDEVGKWDEFNSSSTLIVSELPETGVDDIDYILKSNDGCIYYKWIDNAWHVIAGSMASVVNELPDVGNELVDYYVLSVDGLYEHYRYINSEFCLIGASSYTKDEIDVKLTDISNQMINLEHTVNEFNGRISAVEAVVSSFGNLISDIVPVDGGIQIIYNDGSTKDVETSDSTVKVEDINKSELGISISYTDGSSKEIEITGGSGGPSTSGTALIARITPSSVQCVHKDVCNIEYNFEAKDASGDIVGDGVATWYVGGIVKATSVAKQGHNSFDISPYLIVGNNNVKLSISVDTGGENSTIVTKTWTVNSINLYAEWEYDDSTINESSTVAIRWTPYGDLKKTTHIVIDGEEVATSETTRSGVAQYVIINKYPHGSHMVELYLTATVNEQEICSNSIFHDMIFVDSTSTACIVASPYPGGTVTQYNTVQIPVVAYDPTSLTADVILNVDGVDVANWENVDRTVHYWNYTPNTAGAKVLRITCGETTKVIYLTVDELVIDNEEVSGYAFRLKASDLAGNEALRAWNSNGVNISFSDNFDWNNGGIQIEYDEAGNPRQYICVKAGTTATINYKLFGTEAKAEGKNFKTIFKVANCREYDAKILECYNNGIGIQMYAHNADVTSEQTAVTTPYAEDTYMEFEFDIYPDSKYHYFMAWMDGVPTACSLYSGTDNFTQQTPQNIVIGSGDCDVYIYMVKAYNNYLTNDNHIENFISDASNAQEMVERYNRNNILNDSGAISYEKLAEQNPDCRVHLWDIPRFTQGKKDYVYDCSYAQIYKNGTIEDQLTAENVTINLQGTSSAGYVEAAGNIDGDFTTGFVDGSGKHIDAYAMTENSIPVNYMNTKVNVASCENVNNACNAEWYNRFQPYLMSNRRKNPKARDCMEFHMGVQFIKDRSHGLFDDDNYHQYAVCNVGNSKKNFDVFHDTENPLDACVEIMNNTSPQCRMISDDFTDELFDGNSYFEFRYPKKPTDEMKDAWKSFVSWMTACNPGGATGKALPSAVTYGAYTFKGTGQEGEVLAGHTVYTYAGTYTKDTYEYRMAKMLDECEDHLIMDSLVYHYLFIERHTMIDNVAKNTFWSSEDLVHWNLVKNYDNDTGDGNNNEGQLVIPYGCEAMDTIGTKNVFNANDTVWFVFINGLYEARQVMFTNREALGAWGANDYLEFFKKYQSYIPERCWVYDFWYKYLRPYEQNGTETYISMLEGGKKTHQREQFERFQELYMSSQYVGSVCTSNAVTIRSYTPNSWAGVAPKNEVELQMYAKCYIVIKVGGITKRIKADRGQSYVLNFNEVGALNDTETYFYTSPMIQKIGDLSHLYPGFCDFASAIRLRSLQIGSMVSGYKNYNLENVAFGNNTMLEYLYIQNCPNVNSSLDLSGLQSLKELDTRGSEFTGFSFAVGGLLNKAYLEAPASLTMRNLYYLTDDNFIVQDYSKLTSLRFEDCPGINSFTLVMLSTKLNRARILDIHWELPNTEQLDRMLKIAGLDENDHHTDIAVLTGYVHTPLMRQKKLEAYNAAWGNLDIEYDSMVVQYLVTFLNADGTPIKDKNGNDYFQWIDRGEKPYDPIAAGEIDAPTMESTDQYIFTFSEWENIDANILDSHTVTASYDKELRQYIVQWLLQPGVVYKSLVATYGACVDCGDEIPTLKDEEASFTYKLFKGWDKSTSNITGNTYVYAIWDKADLPAIGKELNEMSVAEIYGIAMSGRADEYFEQKDYLDIKVGHDFSFTNVEEKMLANEMYFDGTKKTVVDTGIQLFGPNAKSFTMAVDFEFTDPTNNATLLSCFEEDGSEGFRLRYNGNPDIQWGDVNKAVGYKQQRGVVALRYIAGENRLRVYAFNSNTSTADVISDSIMYSEISRSRATNTEATIVLGGIKFLADGGLDCFAKGFIHYAKVWFDDLGDKIAKQLVASPHEIWRFEFCGANRYRYTGGTSKKSGMSFICNHLLNLKHSINPTNTNTGGWAESSMRQLANTRIYNAFPVEWQAAIGKVRINSTTGSQSAESIVTSEDYIYLASVTEVCNKQDAPYPSEGEYIPWYTSFQSRLKWKGRIVREDAKIYSGAVDPTTESSDVVSGDIWYISSITQKYMFVDQSEMDKYGITPSKTARYGGWIEAERWALRSAVTTTTASFMIVDYDGQGDYTGSASSAYGICPCFSI